MKNSLSSPNNYLPISEAAKFLGVSLDTLRRWDKSGTLKSKRLDGKNRYYSLEDLKKNKSNRPLSISEASKKFNVSATTLRRLEARGIIKPFRNKAGERLFDSKTIESFLNSEYFQRKKYTLKKAKPKKEQPVVHPEPIAAIKETPVKKDLPEESNWEPKPLLGNFLAISIASFVLLSTVGLGNIFLHKTQGFDLLPLPMVLGESFSASPLMPAIKNPIPEKISEISTEIQIQEPETVSNQIQIEEPKTALEKYLSESLKMINENKDWRYRSTDLIRLVEINADLNEADIKQFPDSLSPTIGQAKKGDVFEFMSFDSGWIQIKLYESTPSGFIREQYAKVKEFNFSSPESGWADINESTSSALATEPVEATKEGEYDQSSN